MRLKFLFLVLLGCKLSALDTASLKIFFQQKFNEAKIPGAAIAVVKNGETIFMQGFGVKKIGHLDAVTTNTVFQLGSISKTLTVALATILEKEGKLSFDMPVSSYFQNSQHKDHLRLQHILSHTSGIPKTGFNNLIEQGLSFDELVETASAVKARPAGQTFSYHNVMFNLIAPLIKAQTNLTYQEALEKYLLKPLGMECTSASFYCLRTSKDCFTPHLKSKNKQYKPCAFSSRYYVVPAAGGINSSIADMAKFLSFLTSSRNPVNPVLQQLYKPLTTTTDATYFGWKKTHKKHLDDFGYGLGFRTVTYKGTHIAYHPGLLAGISQILLLVPSKNIGIVILQNTQSDFSRNTAFDFVDKFVIEP